MTGEHMRDTSTNSPGTTLTYHGKTADGGDISDLAVGIDKAQRKQP